MISRAQSVFIPRSNEERVKFAVDEGFATAGYVLPRAPRPESVAAGLDAAKATAAEILKSYAAPDTDGFDIVMECTGVESCMQAAVHVSPVRQSASVSSILTCIPS